MTAYYIDMLQEATGENATIWRQHAHVGEPARSRVYVRLTAVVADDAWRPVVPLLLDAIGARRESRE